MQVSVTIPSQKPDPLLKQLLTQFERLQKQLMSLKSEPKSDQTATLLKAMAKQQQSVATSVDKLLDGLKTSLARPTAQSSDMGPLLRGLRQALEGLPSDLRSALKTSSPPKASSSPADVHVTMAMPKALSSRLDALTQAMAKSPKGMRSRTFGSNY